MPSCNTYHLTWVSLTTGMGYLFMAAPVKHSHCSLHWTRGISLWETLDWKKHKLESRLPGEISITSDKQMTPLLKWRGTKKPLDESERGEWKSWLKAQHSENEDHGIWSHHFIANRWRNNGNSVRLYFGGLQNHCRMVTAALKLKDAYPLEGKLWPT